MGLIDSIKRLFGIGKAKENVSERVAEGLDPQEQENLLQKFRTIAAAIYGNTRPHVIDDIEQGPTLRSILQVMMNIGGCQVLSVDVFVREDNDIVKIYLDELDKINLNLTALSIFNLPPTQEEVPITTMYAKSGMIVMEVKFDEWDVCKMALSLDVLACAYKHKRSILLMTSLARLFPMSSDNVSKACFMFNCDGGAFDDRELITPINRSRLKAIENAIWRMPLMNHEQAALGCYPPEKWARLGEALLGNGKTEAALRYLEKAEREYNKQMFANERPSNFLVNKYAEICFILSKEERSPFLRNHYAHKRADLLNERIGHIEHLQLAPGLTDAYLCLVNHPGFNIAETAHAFVLENKNDEAAFKKISQNGVLKSFDFMKADANGQLTDEYIIFDNGEKGLAIIGINRLPDRRLCLSYFAPVTPWEASVDLPHLEILSQNQEHCAGYFLFGAERSDAELDFSKKRKKALERYAKEEEEPEDYVYLGHCEEAHQLYAESLMHHNNGCNGSQFAALYRAMSALMAYAGEKDENDETLAHAISHDLAMLLSSTKSYAASIGALLFSDTSANRISIVSHAHLLVKLLDYRIIPVAERELKKHSGDEALACAIKMALVQALVNAGKYGMAKRVLNTLYSSHSIEVRRDAAMVMQQIINQEY